MTEPDAGTLSIDGRPVPVIAGDTILDALARAGELPTSGGTLCCAGDCPHCVAIVDGIAYTRTCQVPAADGQVVERHPAGGQPPLPAPRDTPPASVRYASTDVVVIGAGESGRAAAAERADRDVLVLDARAGEEVIGIYPGPLVVARTRAGMLHVACEEIVVATGAAEIQPVCEGNELAGLVTARAAERLHQRGVDLGSIVAVGVPPLGVAVTPVEGSLVRFEGAGRVERVVVAIDGTETAYPADTVTVGLGVHPRDGLARMGNGLPVTVVGSAAGDATLPPCPTSGTVCPCAGVTVDDLDSVWERGFHEMELLKRATLAGTGTCQGAACLPHLRSFLAERGGELQPAFTARPVSRPLTIGEISAGVYEPAHPRTALHDEHLALGATMERMGGWWRPWTYGDTDAEYVAVRERVSVGDVGTLGKLLVAGPDAEAFLQRIYPTDVSTIRIGRSRYVLVLDERGYVMDDGMLARVSDTEFAITSTSGGAGHTEMWLRDWGSDFDVRIANLTAAQGAINLTGPQARSVLEALGAGPLPPYLGRAAVEVAGIPCTVWRLSFTGELSYELHHPADRSVELWRALLTAGAPLGIAPHGLAALLRLRLDKGHILVGQDSDFDSTPRRLDHEWMVDLESGGFLGRDALLRIDGHQPDKQLVGLMTDGEAPFEGAVVWNEDEYAGYVTSSAWSPAVGAGIMLAWVRTVDGVLPDEVTVEGRLARRVSTPFYDPEGARARA